MPVSRRVRDEAIELLLCAADRFINQNNLNPRLPELYYSARQRGDGQMASKAARDLAYKAYLCPQIRPLEFLEAAGLLLDGWSPGDVLEVRR